MLQSTTLQPSQKLLQTADAKWGENLFKQWQTHNESAKSSWDILKGHRIADGKAASAKGGWWDVFENTKGKAPSSTSADVAPKAAASTSKGTSGSTGSGSSTTVNGPKTSGSTSATLASLEAELAAKGSTTFKPGY